MSDEQNDLNAAIVHMLDCALTPAQGCQWGYTNDPLQLAIERRRARDEVFQRSQKVAFCDIAVSMRHYERRYSEVHPREKVVIALNEVFTAMFNNHRRMALAIK